MTEKASTDDQLVAYSTKQERPKLMSRSIEEVKELIETTHTTRLKNICQILKCSRKFANDNIVEYFQNPEDYALITPNFGIGILKKSMCGKYYDTKKIEDFIKKSIVKIERQTINVDVSYFIDNKKEAEEWAKKADKIMEYWQTKDGNEFDNYCNADKELLKLTKEYMDTKAPKKSGIFAFITKRTDAPWIDVTSDYINKIDIHELFTVPSVKDYGDTDEGVYRAIFGTGCLKVTLQFSHYLTGEISQKTMYYSVTDYDNDYYKHRLNLTIKYAQFEPEKVKYIPTEYIHDIDQY